jgi:hypothetical protein
MVKTAVLVAVAVGTTTFKLLLDQATLQAPLLLKAIMVEMLRQSKTTVVAVVALVQSEAQGQAVWAAMAAMDQHQVFLDRASPMLAAVVAVLLALPAHREAVELEAEALGVSI